MAKKKVIIETKYQVKGADNAEKSYEGIGKEAEKAAESTDKVNDSMSKSGGAAKGASGGVGKLLDGFKAIVLNPIGLTITALVAAFMFVKDAIAGSEEASNKLSQGFAYLKGFIVPLQNAVLTAFDIIVDAVSSPGEAFDKMVTGIETAVNYWKDNILAPYLSAWKLLGLAIFKQITKIRIAWNNLTGDVEESEELQNKLKEIEDDITANAKVITDAANTIKNDVVDAVEAVVEGVKTYVEEATKLGDKLVDLTKREQELLKIRRQQEVQNAKAMADMEELKTIRDDEAQSLEDRIKANERIGEIEKKRVADAMSLARAELKLLNDRIALQGKASTEELDQQKELSIAIQELRAESAGIENEQVVNKTALMTEEFDKQAAIIDKELELTSIREKDSIKLADAQVAAAQKKLDALAKLGLKEKAQYIEQQNALEIAVATAEQAKIDKAKEVSDKKKETDKKNAEEAFNLNKANADAAIGLAADLAATLSEAKLKANDEEMEALEASLEAGNITEEEYNKKKQELADEAFRVKRNAALMELAVNTASAISSLVAMSAANPANAVTGGLAGILQYASGALTIGTNIASAAALLNEKPPKIKTGNAGGSAPDTKQTSPSRGFDGFSAGTENFGPTIIRAYVTESDITTSQNTASSIESLSEIG